MYKRQIQAYVSRDLIGEEDYTAFKRWDMGDIVGVVGRLFRTRTGELTVECSEIRLLTKSLRPLPEKFHGLTDQEQKCRMRYVDLITSEPSRQTFVVRSRIVQSIRNFMVQHLSLIHI